MLKLTISIEDPTTNLVIKWLVVFILVVVANITWFMFGDLYGLHHPLRDSQIATSTPADDNLDQTIPTNHYPPSPLPARFTGTGRDVKAVNLTEGIYVLTIEFGKQHRTTINLKISDAGGFCDSLVSNALNNYKSIKVLYVTPSGGISSCQPGKILIDTQHIVGDWTLDIRSQDQLD